MNRMDPDAKKSQLRSLNCSAPGLYSGIVGSGIVGLGIVCFGIIGFNIVSCCAGHGTGYCAGHGIGEK